MAEFKKGAFTVAAKEGAPVVPITLDGTGRLMRNGAHARAPKRGIRCGSRTRQAARRCCSRARSSSRFTRLSLAMRIRCARRRKPPSSLLWSPSTVRRRALVAPRSRQWPLLCAGGVTRSCDTRVDMCVVHAVVKDGGSTFLCRAGARLGQTLGPRRRTTTLCSLAHRRRSKVARPSSLRPSFAMLLHQGVAASLACAPPRGVVGASPVSRRRGPAARPAQRLPRSPLSSPCAAQLRSRTGLTTARNAKGDGPVGAWLDLAALVSSSSKAPGMSEFATEIGRDIYVDIAGWHLVRRPSWLGAAAHARLGAFCALVAPLFCASCIALLRH